LPTSFNSHIDGIICVGPLAQRIAVHANSRLCVTPLILLERAPKKIFSLFHVIIPSQYYFATQWLVIRPLAGAFFRPKTTQALSSIRFFIALLQKHSGG